MTARIRANIRLSPDVCRILYIKNLPFAISDEDMFDIFGKFGPIRQIRKGDQPETRGSAFVIYDDIFDAKNACDHLNGYSVHGRYLACLYYHKERSQKKLENQKKMEVCFNLN